MYKLPKCSTYPQKSPVWPEDVVLTKPYCIGLLRTAVKAELESQIFVVTYKTE